MRRTCLVVLISSLTYLGTSGVAAAGTITAQGEVTALDDISQVTSVTGFAMFDEMQNGMIPLDQYADVGMTLNVGEFAMILPGVMEVGEVADPMFTGPGVHFPDPIAGGGVQQNSIILAGGAATFSDPVTQFGLTAGGSSLLYITVWDQAGVMLGQVTWEPEEMDSSFVGIDTGGVAIGMLTVGNDDVFGGVEYDALGAAARSDNWIWGLGDPCATEADCFDDLYACTAHACENGACVYSLTTEPCDDGSACTDNDVCADGLCGGVEIECADTNVCTFDTCDPSSGCQNNPIEDCCLSDDDCPDGQPCIISSNTCEPPGPPPPPPPPETGEGGDESTDTGTQDSGETGPAADDGGGGGCSCSAPERGGGALFGLLGLVLLGTLRRRERA